MNNSMIIDKTTLFQYIMSSAKAISDGTKCFFYYWQNYSPLGRAWKAHGLS